MGFEHNNIGVGSNHKMMLILIEGEDVDRVSPFEFWDRSHHTQGVCIYIFIEEGAYIL